MDHPPYSLGRGPVAAADMKARIAALREAGYTDQELFAILWDRTRQAELGEGYTYEFAEPLRSGRDSGR